MVATFWSKAVAWEWYRERRRLGYTVSQPYFIGHSQWAVTLII